MDKASDKRLSVWWNAVVVDEELCEIGERTRERRGGERLALRLDRKKENDELGVARREVAEEGVECAVGVVSPAARYRDLRSAGLCGERVAFLF